MAKDEATAPFMPSGWLCVGMAVLVARSTHSLEVVAINPAAATRMALPLPNELYAGVTWG